MTETETRLQLATKAARLRADGLTGIAIAERLSISRSYAYELLGDPDGSLAKARKRRYVGTCEGCGGPTSGSNGAAAAPPMCDSCRRQLEAEERARIVAAWNAGESAETIAAREGCTVTAVHSRVDKARRQHGEDAHLRRRRRRELWPAIEQLFKQGRSYPEIAEALGISSGLVGQTVQQMRHAGRDLPMRCVQEPFEVWAAPILALAEGGPIVIADLRDVLGMTRSCSRSRVAILQREGLIARGPRSECGTGRGVKAWTYTLTEKGRQELHRLREGG